MARADILIPALRTAAAAVGIFIVVMNWASLASRRSWTPLLGGALLALVALSIRELRPFFWVPLLLDFGSIPGLAWTFGAWVVRVRRTASRNND